MFAFFLTVSQNYAFDSSKMSDCFDDLETGEYTIEDATGDVYLHTIELNVQTRDFKGQTSGDTKSPAEIRCNSVPEFKEKLWLLLLDNLKREVIFDDQNNPQWHTNVTPQEEDVERYILFYDLKSKRSITLDKVNTISLNHWRTKEIWLYVHSYSMSVSNLSPWKKVQKTLIEPVNRDRAGANTIAEMNEIVRRLKEVHKLNYQSSHINWIMWANRIQSSEPHLHEKLLSDPPPPDMLHLFAIVRNPSDNVISDVRHNISVAEGVNKGVGTSLSKIRTLVDDIIKAQTEIDTPQSVVKTKTELLNHELTTMEVQTTATRSLITSMGDALPATATDFGRQIFSMVQNQEDVDHAVDQD